MYACRFLPFISPLSLFLSVLAPSSLALSSPGRSPSPSSSIIKLELIPSSLECKSVVQSYPVTLLSKLFSSVPKREFAVQDVSLQFSVDGDGDGGATSRVVGDDNGGGKGDAIHTHLNFNLLVGRSASGKSTILRIVSGEEEPLSGNVLLNDSNLYHPPATCSNDREQSEAILLPKPIMLDSKPDCFDDRATVWERIVASASVSAMASARGNEELSQLDETETLVESLGREYAAMLNLSDDELKGVSSDLSPSGQYLFGIALACMESSTMGVSGSRSIASGDEDNDANTNANANAGSRTVQVALPILLLDELLDSETSAVAGKVGQGLRNLTRRGGIVLAATHRPEYLSSVADRTITMSGGKVLLVK